MARLLVDMNLSTEWIPLLRAAGHEAVHWSEVGDPRAPDGDLMAVSVSLKPTAVVGPPQKLFRTAIDPGGAIGFFQFDAHPDNERFIMAVPVNDAPQPVNVVLNWQSLLKRLP